MFEKKFINKNIKKIKKNLKYKDYNLNKKITKFFINIKKNISKKQTIFNRIKKGGKKYIEKKYILKIKNIYKSYLKKINKCYKILILKIPNLIHYNFSEKNKIIKKKKFFKKKYEKYKKNIFNIKISNKTSGKGFFYISKSISLIYNIIENYIINIHIKEHNYKYLIVPIIMNFKSLINSGQLPKFIKKLFIIKNKKKIKYLIPTSEVSIINFMINKKIKSKFLPIKFMSKTECFRNENLLYGKHNNIIKRKQFNKIELIQFVDNKNGYNYLKELIKNIEKIIKNFKINYRIVKLSKKEITYSSTTTYDLEVWLPSVKNYCEISSCSNTENYQSIRSNSKYINIYSKNSEYFSILNGSGVALGRFFLSILENYKIKKNILNIPKVLKKIVKLNFFKF